MKKKKFLYSVNWVDENGQLTGETVRANNEADAYYEAGKKILNRDIEIDTKINPGKINRNKARFAEAIKEGKIVG